MYHYLGNFQLYETSKFHKYSGYRCLCRIDDAYFTGKIEMLDRTELAPGEFTRVQIWFLCIDLVAPRIQVGSIYQVCEGSRPIGEISIAQDPWNEVEKWILVGETRTAVIQSIEWTRAIILVEGGITTVLSSHAMGLQAWEEISQVLKNGDVVKVQIEEIDIVERKINVSLVLA